MESHYEVIMTSSKVARFLRFLAKMLHFQAKLHNEGMKYGKKYASTELEHGLRFPKITRNFVPAHFVLEQSRDQV